MVVSIVGRNHRHTQTVEGFPNGKQPVSLTLRGLYSPTEPCTPQEANAFLNSPASSFIGRGAGQTRTQRAREELPAEVMAATAHSALDKALDSALNSVPEQDQLAAVDAAWLLPN